MLQRFGLLFIINFGTIEVVTDASAAIISMSLSQCIGRKVERIPKKVEKHPKVVPKEYPKPRSTKYRIRIKIFVDYFSLVL